MLPALTAMEWAVRKPPWNKIAEAKSLRNVSHLSSLLLCLLPGCQEVPSAFCPFLIVTVACRHASLLQHGL
ncbi:mCG1026161, isoform CRA_b [Mus musculus]|nr:mCG1026161, isoform CRA_b [Mus musculus]